MKEEIEQEVVLVETVSGKQVPEESCRKIGGEYYQIGNVEIENSGDCYFIKDKYRKVKTKFIVYDHTIKRYVLKGDFKESAYTVKEGVVGFSKDGITPLFGAFSLDVDPSTLPVIEIRTPETVKTYKCISEDIFKDSISYKEHLRKNMYVSRNYYNAASYTEKVPCNKEYKNKLSYDSRGLTAPLQQLHNELYSWNDSKYLFKENDLLKGLSFGVEFETTKGFVPKNICDRLGLLPLRDGSIQGLEYVTVPLEGNKGIHALYDITKELKKRTEYNTDCSLHYHIGNVPRTESFFLALFKVLFLIQDDMYKLFPIYKQRNCGIKRKAYTKPLPLEVMVKLDRVIDKSNIKDNFCKLFSFLSMGYSYSDYGHSLDKIKNHPSDPGGNSKWNIKTRYYWVNLIPLLFGNKQTVEFRMHTATLEPQKVLNYLMMCANIVNFVKSNQDAILKDEIGKVYLRKIIANNMNYKTKASNLNDELRHYVDMREHAIANCLKRGDIIADEDSLFAGSNVHRYFNWKILEINPQSRIIRKSPADKYLEKAMNYAQVYYQENPVPVGNVEINIGNAIDEILEQAPEENNAWINLEMED